MTDDLPEPEWAPCADMGDALGPYASRVAKARTAAELAELLESLIGTLRRVNAGEASNGTKQELVRAVGVVFARRLQRDAKAALERAEALLQAEGKQPRALSPLSPKQWVTQAKRALQSSSGRGAQ